MKAKAIFLSLAILLGSLVFSLEAQAETLLWNAITTYTDGSSIGSATVTYTPVWSTSTSLSSPNALGTSTTSTSKAFNTTTEAMPRGSTIYFGVRATVGGVDSAYSAPLSWVVPTIAPSSPGNLRVQ